MLTTAFPDDTAMRVLRFMCEEHLE